MNRIYILILFTLCFFRSNLLASENLKTIDIQTKDKLISYQVEIADTLPKMEKGLMNRKYLPPHQGMIFFFFKEQMITMWMKDTYLPLDMIFINSENKILHIHENAKPLDKTLISSIFPVSKVLEINAGEVQKNQIKIGQKIFLH